MYVYRQTEKTLWTVGHYDPEGKWCPESDHPDPELAAKRVSFLNGASAVNATLDEALNSGDGSYRP